MKEAFPAKQDLGQVREEDLLRALLMRRVGEVRGNNQRFETLAERMRADAREFAETMRAVGAATDKATTMRQVSKGDLFRYPKYEDVYHDVWILQTEKRYGGGKLEGRHSRDRYRTYQQCLAILSSDDERENGALALVDFNKCGEGLLEDWFDQLPPSYFIKRDGVDSDKAARVLRAQWIEDLREAAERYTHEPFVPFNIER